MVLPEADVVLELPPLEVRVGEDFHLTLQLTNRSEKRRVVNGYVSGTVVYYTGVTSSEFLFKTPRMTLDPMQSEGMGRKGCVCVRWCVWVCVCGGGVCV